MKFVIKHPRLSLEAKFRTIWQSGKKWSRYTRKNQVKVTYTFAERPLSVLAERRSGEKKFSWSGNL